MSALTDAVIALVNQLRMRPDATRRVSILPLGSIFWEDEWPEYAKFVALSDEEKESILRLYSLRRKIWDGAELPAEDALFWETAQAEAPDWALFHRLWLSDADREYRKKAEGECDKAFEMLCSEADECEVADKSHGLQEFRLKFDLTK